MIFFQTPIWHRLSVNRQLEMRQARSIKTGQKRLMMKLPGGGTSVFEDEGDFQMNPVLADLTLRADGYFLVLDPG